MKITAGALAYFAGSSLVFGSEMSQQSKDAFLRQLAVGFPRLDGVFVFDDATCRSMATDFGHNVHHLPIGVLFPASDRDIVQMVRYAALKNLKISMRGQGHSAYGQTQVEKGIVINSASFRGMRWSSNSSMDVQPGALWSDISKFALSRGLMAPVTPDTLFLSAGGTLSGGGIGETSYRLGAQVDHVLEVDVVTGTGQLVTCAPNINGDLFRAILGGMGQCGLMTRIRLRLLPAPRFVVMRDLEYIATAPFLNDLARAATHENAGAIAGRLARNADGTWTAHLGLNSWTSGPQDPGLPNWFNELGGRLSQPGKVIPFDAYLNRATQGFLQSVQNGSILVPHPYLSFFLPASESAAMLDHLVRTPDAALGAAQIAVFPMFNRYFRQPLQKMPAGDLSYHIRIYRKAQQEGSADHLKMLQLNQQLLPWILSKGGTVYPPHAPILNSSQWLMHFGAATSNQFALAKRRFDPNHILTPGAGIFAN